MHYYQFHIGDYATHTRHLTPIEDIAYRRLLDIYYLHERPLSDCLTTVARQINMREYETEVDLILTEFFDHIDGGYINRRADKEIQHYKAKVEQASKAGKASAERRNNGRSTDVQPTNNHKPITINHTSIDQFEIFWKGYPKKTAKENAKKAWLKIKPNDELIAKITKAVKEQKLSERESQFIPHAATWLNAKRWEDELSSTTQKPLMGWK
jgi:uncharacterized protein YdaU (DUF1376 family)